MERPTVSLLRSYEPFYGARIFVVLSSGKRKLLKLDFSAESGKVMNRKTEFISPRGEQITSVTVMLGCFGYEGYVTFTDLAVKPIYDSRLLKNHSIEPKQLLEPCQALSKRPLVESGDFLTEILYSACSPTDSDAVTLVTQLTFNRINMLKRNLRFWTGPLSIVVYVHLEDANDIDFKKREVQMRLPSPIFSKFSTVSVMVIYGKKIGPQYPINRLRNIAVKNVKTQYIFMIDVDFVPSPELETIARNQILKYNETRNGTNNKVAFVVPAFDGARNVNSRDLPQTKEELVKMVKRKKKLAPFRQIESPLSHSSTNYTKWYHINESYEVSRYQDKYEPYLILRLTPELPLYDERFTGYGMNKISHVIELALLRQVTLSLDFIVFSVHA
ncbi:LARGE xylosyl- and glucuronyltransferase 2-like [Orbicella faveolata]|uniref:LARGE xylosyl- and glucuronyltransferase 2-like n=1 Tax=Orbicella faveolata TaxID=48498 RepID=UPI0009E2EB6B|nr:LARGE xylosyl- and glucuronyltransferase 2-like [Orbicella faveolata]